MPKPVPRAVLWGTMAIGETKRRSYLFRVDPAGLVAVRIGSPLAWSAFFAVVLLFYIFLSGPLGIGALLAGGAVGMAALGILDRTIARAVATQPRERVLKSAMNRFLPKEDWGSAQLQEGQGYTYVELTSQGLLAALAIRAPRPPRARELLKALLASSRT